MNLLEQYGWNAYRKNSPDMNGAIPQDFLLGRVISLQGLKYHLISEIGETEAELSGKVLFGTPSESLPGVGDWVFYLAYGAQGYITELLPRFNTLSRRQPGNRTERQVLAANIDFALIVQGLDRDFNLMRLDRYIVQITACGITPIVVMNKADLISDLRIYEDEVARLGRDCRVCWCSTYSREGLDELYEQVLLPGETHILLGSSGVGKSSLLNALMVGRSRKTATVSDSTGKGKHITTTRDLFQLPNGSLVIDTPGMREFGMALDDADFSAGLFPAIDLLARDCRYADCRHLLEEGCAVIAACATGNLDQKIYDSYRKLMKEQQRFEIRAEDKKRLGKQFGKMVREAREYRRKYKY